MSEELEKSKRSAQELKASLEGVNQAAADARSTFNDIAGLLGRAASKIKILRKALKLLKKM